jgi:non-ribosomal peptide synthetase component F
MDRCVHLPLALLSIIKSGAAYLPLDPSQPLLRLQSILDESTPSAILVDGNQNLPELEWNAPLIDVRHLDAETEKASMQSPRFNPENAAYVIYTSGSTGRSKGVINTHGAIVNRLLWMQDQYQLDISDRVLQKTPTGFDVSVWEFF